MRYSQASRCGTFAFDCFDFKVRPGSPGLTNIPGSAQTVQPQVSTDYLLLQTFFIQLYSAIAVLATCINVAVEWAKEMGVEFRVEKTVVMLFTNKRATSYQMPNSLNLYGQEIPFSKTAKYLGVTLDDMLSWRPHIENKI
jgi:hypothetical protein